MLCSAQYTCKFSETTGPTEAFHVTPPWERGKGGKLIKMIQAINFVDSHYCQPRGRGNLAWILPQI